MNRQNILFDVNIAGDWIGGIYYVRNILYQIIHSEKAYKNCYPVIICSTKYMDLFREFEGKADIYVFPDGNRAKRIQALFKALRKCHWIYRYNQYKFDPLNLLKKKAIYWIPDFQEYHYPAFFSPEEVERRRTAARWIAESCQPLVLSSEDSKRDFTAQFGSKKKKVFVVPFVSAISEEVFALTEERCKEIRKRYGLENQKFVLIANQFWVHKNHKVVLEAIAALEKTGRQSQTIYVFTGAKKDYRNENHFNTLTSYIEENQIGDWIRFLGFIDRDDQLGLMKQAEYLIQPSLFEGWGTVLEDAKVLDKTVLLSDIPVHKEQKNEKCILFDPYNPEELADRMAEENAKEHNDNMNKGIADMQERALRYADAFAEMIEEIAK